MEHFGKFLSASHSNEYVSSSLVISEFLFGFSLGATPDTAQGLLQPTQESLRVHHVVPG